MRTYTCIHAYTHTYKCMHVKVERSWHHQHGEDNRIAAHGGDGTGDEQQPGCDVGFGPGRAPGARALPHGAPQPRRTGQDQGYDHQQIQQVTRPTSKV